MPEGVRVKNGKVHFNFGWYGILFIAFLIAVVYGYGIVGSAGGWAGPAIGSVFLAVGLVFFRKSMFRIPAVEVSEEGVTIRPVLARGCVFVKWEDIREVVIWYHSTGGQKNRMIGIRANEGFAYDNYGVHPCIRPNIGRRHIRGVPRYVGDLVGRWSVDIVATKPRKIAALIKSTGNDITVSEVPIFDQEIWRFLDIR